MIVIAFPQSLSKVPFKNLYHPIGQVYIKYTELVVLLLNIVRQSKLNSQFIVTARSGFSIFTENFKFLLWITPLAIEGVPGAVRSHSVLHG